MRLFPRAANPAPSARIQRATLTASASKAGGDNGKQNRRLHQDWQARALDYYNTIGECWYPAQFYARTLSGVRFFPAILDEKGDPQEVEDGPLVELFDRIQDPGGGRTDLTGTYGRLMFLTGDGYLVAGFDEDYDDEVWEFLSPLELRTKPDSGNGRRQEYTRLRAPGATQEELTEASDSDFEPIGNQVRVWRLYRRHPSYSRWADSPVRAVLDLYELLRTLTASAGAESTSRLDRGGFYLPNELRFSTPSEDGGPEDPSVEIFLQEWQEGMTAAIKNPGDASAMSPLVLTGPAFLQGPNGTALPMKDAIGYFQIGRQNDYKEAEMWDKTILRISYGLDLPKERVTGVGDLNHWCVDEQTEILTRDRGWVGQDQLEVGDVVRTLNHETGLAEWQPTRDIYRADVVDEPMRQLEGRTHSSLTTLNHRWPVLHMRYRDGKPYISREWKETRDLNAYDSIITGAFAGDDPDVASQRDDVVELAAWFWTEGNIGRGGNAVTIAQSHTRNPQRVDRIRSSLTRVFGPAHESLRSLDFPGWRETIQPNESSHGGPITVFHLNRHASATLLEAAPAKRLNPDFLCSLTRAQLDLFIDVSCQGDGHHYHSGQLDIWQKDPTALDGYELAVVLSGRASSRQPAHDEGTVVRALRSLSVRPVKAAEQASRTNTVGATDSVIPYTGVVWCPTTANHTWLARRNGRTFFTGNSGWLVDEEGFRQHVAPIAEKFCADVNAAYLRPAAIAAGIAQAERVVIGFDPADAINHPDEVKTAREAYRDAVVGGDFYRERIGATEADEPDDEEKAFILALQGKSLPGEEEEQDAETNPADGGRGGDTEEEPPEIEDAEQNGNGPNAQVAAARIGAAIEMTLERAREAAGNRLVARSQGCEECKQTIKDVPASLVASALGPEQVRDIINGHTTEAQLVAGTGSRLADTVRRWGVPAAVASELGELVERHALKTLYESDMDGLPGDLVYAASKAVAA